MLVLGVDCGTQSLRAALYDTSGALLAQAASPYPTRCPHINWAEQSPDDWWNALCSSVRQCLAEAKVSPRDIAAIACDGTSFTGVFCTETGEPLRPAILWMDLRAADEARRVEATRDAALESCGGRISAEWFLPKSLWVAAHEPDLYARTDRVIEGVDWLIHRLTGRWVTSNSNASGKRHWTPSGGWPSTFYASLGMPRLVEQSPDAVVYLGDAVGTITADAAHALGLDPSCIVSHAGMDGWTSPVGKDCFEEGTVSLTLGTSTVLIAETSGPKRIDGVMGPFPDGIRRERFAYEAGQASGASIIGWAAKMLARDHETLAAEAAAIPPGSDGLVVFDAWRGNRTPYFDPLARGTICGLTLEHTPGHMYRAVLEGCAFGIRNVVETIERGGIPVREFRACGSGTGNPLWTQIIADVTGTPLRISREKHATCLGSAMCAAVACGAYSSLEAAASAMAPEFDTIEPSCESDRYKDYFEAYLGIYRGLKGTMHRLARLAEPKEQT